MYKTFERDKNVIKRKHDRDVNKKGMLIREHDQPDARVVPTPFKFVKVAMALSKLGSLRKAFRLTVCTAFGVLIRTRLVNWGKNLPRCKYDIGPSKSDMIVIDTICLMRMFEIMDMA